MKRIEKTLLHNPDPCPFGLVAQGKKDWGRRRGRIIPT